MHQFILSYKVCDEKTEQFDLLRLLILPRFNVADRFRGFCFRDTQVTNHVSNPITGGSERAFMALVLPRPFVRCGRDSRQITRDFYCRVMLMYDKGSRSPQAPHE